MGSARRAVASVNPTHSYHDSSLEDPNDWAPFTTKLHPELVRRLRLASIADGTNIRAYINQVLNHNVPPIRESLSRINQAQR